MIMYVHSSQEGQFLKIFQASDVAGIGALAPVSLAVEGQVLVRVFYHLLDLAELQRF
jgi:hypothetical protein